MYKIVSPKSQTAYSVRIVCGLIFILFCGIFLYVQSPLLEALQHELSEGKTSYSPIWGTIIITLVLYIIQNLIHHYTRFAEYCHAISYIPSLLILAFITDKNRGIYQAEYIDSSWKWILIASILMFISFIWINKKWLLLFNTKTNFPDLASKLWPNIFILNLLFIFVLYISNLEPTFHYETKIESLIRQGKYEEACKVGNKNTYQISHELTALRAYTLSRTDSLGSRLFEYPQLYQAEGLLLNKRRKTTSMKAEELYNYLGDKPYINETTLHYLFRICQTETGSYPALDYYLCALLLEKKLDLFVNELQNLYFIDENLPRHYKEALILYHHRHGEYKIPFNTIQMEQDYQQFLLHQHLYPKTYWWYYFHTNVK